MGLNFNTGSGNTGNGTYGSYNYQKAMQQVEAASQDGVWQQDAANMHSLAATQKWVQAFRSQMRTNRADEAAFDPIVADLKASAESTTPDGGGSLDVSA